MILFPNSMCQPESYIPFIDSCRVPCFEDLKTFGHDMEWDWNGFPCNPPPRFLLWRSLDHLYFLARCFREPRLRADVTPGSFFEGLWEVDVVEFFIGSTSQPERYIEFNLAPHGAWWWAQFDGPRQRCAEPPMPPHIETHWEISSERWYAMATLPLHALPALDQARANVTAIIGDPPQFLSVSPPQTTKPDFHQPTGFLPMEGMILQPSPDAL